jgi:hypothetical protein
MLSRKNSRREDDTAGGRFRRTRKKVANITQKRKFLSLTSKALHIKQNPQGRGEDEFEDK